MSVGTQSVPRSSTVASGARRDVEETSPWRTPTHRPDRPASTFDRRLAAVAARRRPAERDGRRRVGRGGERARRPRARSRPPRTPSSARSWWPGNTVYTLDLKCEDLHREVPEGVAAGPAARRRQEGRPRATASTRRSSARWPRPTARCQVTYGGDPLFWSAKDKSPGDVKGAVTRQVRHGALVVTAKASSDGSQHRHRHRRNRVLVPAPVAARPSCRPSSSSPPGLRRRRTGRDAGPRSAARLGPRCRRACTSRRARSRSLAVVLIGVGWARDWGGADFAGSVDRLRAIVAGPVDPGDHRRVPRRRARLAGAAAAALRPRVTATTSSSRW